MNPTRKEFLLDVAGLAAAPAVLTASAPGGQPRVLLVVAHPDDEYTFAATVYRITHELNGTVDQVVITNGEAGFRYSRLAEAYYGMPLTRESTGRSQLPRIRKEETRRAGRILGIRKQVFLDQTDAKFTLDGNEALSGIWDLSLVRSRIAKILAQGQYEFVMVLLPTRETHGHHQAAAALALEAVRSLAEDKRPAVLGSEPSGDSVGQWGSEPQHVYRVSRTQPLPKDASLSYSIVVNWVVAEHKSQGLLQTESSRHAFENFWVLEKGAVGTTGTDRLFANLTLPRTAAAAGN